MKAGALHCYRQYSICMAGVLCQILVSILSVSVKPLEMLWAEAAIALAPLCGDWKPEDLLRPFLLMWVFKKLNLS